MLVRPAVKRLFCLRQNGRGRFAPSALPHYDTGMYTYHQYLVTLSGPIISNWQGGPVTVYRLPIRLPAKSALTWPVV